MADKFAVSPETFSAIQNLDADKLSSLVERDLRPILPCLVRMSLCAPADSSEAWTEHRKRILQILSGVEVVNNVVQLLSVDFHELEVDARKEQHLRSKAGGNQTESIFISQLQNSVSLEFERADAPRRLHLVLSELLFVMAQIKEPRQDFYQKSSEIFECEVYLEEIADVIAIAQAGQSVEGFLLGLRPYGNPCAGCPTREIRTSELPSLLPMSEVAEALLHVKNGEWVLCRLVANIPDSFHQVCSDLVANGEKQDEDVVGGRRRTAVLKTLCEMNPAETLAVRTLCIEHCRLPGLAVALTLQHCKLNQANSELIPFVTGMLLGNDPTIRTWFGQFVKNGQKRKRDPTSSMLHSLRQRLLEELVSIIPDSGSSLTENTVIQASCFVRMYAALKGIATLKLSEEEIKLLLRLISSHPPPTEAGVRFISLGLCMLITCPYLLGNPEQERTAVEWIRWLVKEEDNFERCIGTKASYSEMLLLIAIHFHSFHTHAIAELVSSTLGMKSVVKANPLARLKAIFTQEIFTEQVVTSQAIRVPVTPSLNAGISGYLPVHCIHQLLKSRAFSKHKVPIREWVFRQICSCSTPIHPTMPKLIEAYVNSVITPASKTDYTNQPIPEQDIINIFQNSPLLMHDGNEQTKLAGKHSAIHSGGDIESMDIDEQIVTTMPVQLLMLYYVLLYQDSVLNEFGKMMSDKWTAGSSAPKKPLLPYSQTLLAAIPMKHLLQQAQRQQQQYAGLFSPLLKLLVTHYPHLCLVEDWLEEDLITSTQSKVLSQSLVACTVETLEQAFKQAQSNPAVLTMHLHCLLSHPAVELLQYMHCVTSSLALLLEDQTPRQILDLVKEVWIKINTVAPRSLRLLTVNALRSKLSEDFDHTPYSENAITVDPLLVLRCDQRVFRCPPLFELLLRVLTAYLQSFRCYLDEHLLVHHAGKKIGNQNGPANDNPQVDLMNALLEAQESAAVQILLECCLPTKDEKESAGLLNSLREVQCLVCTHLHQMFIANTNLAKLVHFQGYPSELLPLTAAGIPSMHICLDFIPELLSQPQIDKQIFAVELASHLCLQYATPKSLSVAKLSVTVMSTLLGVLPSDVLPDFFIPTLPALVRMCQAFPPLHDDVTSLLTQLGKVCQAKVAAQEITVVSDLAPPEPVLTDSPSSENKLNTMTTFSQLSSCIQKTFSNIVTTAVITKDIY